MKNVRVRQWFSALAALLLLTSSAMPAVVRMTCVNGGHTVLSIGQAEDCCPDSDQQEGASIQAICCEFQEAAPQRAEFSAEHQVAFQLPEVLLYSSGVSDSHVADLRTPTDRGSERPPPLYVLERLSQLCSFRI
ncbi:MAG: hypothetical protein IPP33_12370 [Flavobacteriales bacterium]|nr:hypothetical protein [Flavobacteriales bacterium]